MNQVIRVACIVLAASGVHLSASAADQSTDSRPVAQMMAMEGEGTIVAVLPDRDQVVIDHEPIGDMMDAMVMGFTVADPKLLEDLKEGQAVTFKLRGHDMVITEISSNSGS